MCVCGCSQILLECNHVGCTYSDRMRGELIAGLDRGENDDLTLQDFVQKYGPTVLAAPTGTGFNRIAWIMPFLALVLGLLTTMLWAAISKEDWRWLGTTYYLTVAATWIAAAVTPSRCSFVTSRSAARNMSILKHGCPAIS
jgi:hypothetical protein